MLVDEAYCKVLVKFRLIEGRKQVILLDALLDESPLQPDERRGEGQAQWQVPG